MTESKPPTPDQRVDQRQQRAIGQVLARRYTDVTGETAPDDMLDLLKTADKLRDARKPNGGS